MENKSTLTDDGEHHGVEPGAARFGNFPDYYKFNPAQERLQYLENLTVSHMAQLQSEESIHCLDIGCNTGELTVLFTDVLKQLFPKKTVYMTAVDVDEKLINCAQHRYASRTEITFQQSDYMADIKLQSTKFSIISCFSVTLWIHLNHGDAGLRKFLKHLQSGNYVFMEAQPWKCYRTAVRRAKRANQPEFTFYQQLEIRNNVVDFIDDYLTSECGFERVNEFGTTNWDRKIILYERRNGAC